MGMERHQRHDLYRRQLLAATPRILSELDRDPFSATYGSFDREYWAWSTKDFSNVDLQRAIYPLTVLFLTPLEGNFWHRSPRLLDWILAAARYWGQVQHADGSFDHHYPFEYSFVGVAFPLIEISLAFRLLDSEGLIPTKDREDWLAIMRKGAEFLCANDELHGFISNHRLGAACALHSMHQICKDAAYLTRALEFESSVRSRMSREGWLCEYEGADPGYQTLDANFIGHYCLLTGDDEFFESVAKPSLDFLQYFLHPDGSIGGEYGSRNCSLYYPGGIEALASSIPVAEAMAAHAAQAIQLGHTPALADHDIRNFVPMLSSYAAALIAAHKDEASERECAELPFKRNFERFWPEAGFYVRSDARHYYIVGCSKGGVFKAFEKASSRLIASHAGYAIEDKRKRLYSNQFLAKGLVAGLDDCSGAEAPLRENRELQLTHPVYAVMRNRVFTPFRFLLFRGFMFTLGRFRGLNEWVKRNIITGLFIHRRSLGPWRFARRIVFLLGETRIEDRLVGAVPIWRARAGDIFTTIYMASSKYYRHQEQIPDALSHKNIQCRDGNLADYRLGKDGLERL
jgi:hypothetical protein